MQPVFKDGALGTVEPFNIAQAEALLRHTNVDHIRVFNQGSGNEVVLEDIKEKDLETKISTLINKRFEEQKWKATEGESLHLMAEFDKKLRSC